MMQTYIEDNIRNIIARRAWCGIVPFAVTACNSVQIWRHVEWTREVAGRLLRQEMIAIAESMQ